MDDDYISYSENTYLASLLDDVPLKDDANIGLLKSYINDTNIAEHLDKSLLRKIGNYIVEEAERDDKTRTEWFDTYNEALKIARQTIEEKNFPFQKSSNVKIPLILQGCIQFNSRLMPEIIRDGKTVRCAVAGVSNDASEQIAMQIANHMTLQTMKIVPNWISDTDRLMMALPLVGTLFRKWSYDSIERRPTSVICLPTEIIIDNETTSLAAAPRITHVMKMSRNEILERMRAGLYLELPLKTLKDSDTEGENRSDDEERTMPSDVEDSRNYHIIYEQCCWWDLDEDGYKEPYIATVNKNTRDVYRIKARYDNSSFVYGKGKKLIKIIPIEYYTAYTFLPAPDGTFLGMGFGQLLLQMNAAINTITNNLIDAATLSNIPGGFISSDLRIPAGELQFNMAGEWKKVKTLLGQNLSNSIYPLPIKEPSQTLLQLLQYLVDFGKQIANVSDVLMGNPISAQMPATSIVTLVEQGSKIFSSILTRIYESLKAEFNILYNINQRYISLYPSKDLMIKDGFISEVTYAEDNYNIYPVANPSLGIDAVRMAKAQVLMQLDSPLIKPREKLMRYLEAIGIGDLDKLLYSDQELQQQPPSADQLFLKSQTDLNNAKVVESRGRMLMEHEQEAFKHELEEIKIKLDAAYKGGMLAVQKGDTIGRLAVAESTINQANIRKAEQLVDEEEAKSTQAPNFSQINEQFGLTENKGVGDNQQNGMNVVPNGTENQTQPPDQTQPPVAGQNSSENQSTVPAYLKQTLQGISESQNQQ